ncbi:MAG: peptidylprolyl isomerase [Phycisphaerae bacterium]
MAWLVNGEKIDAAGIDAEFERLKPHYDEYVRANDPDGESSDEQLREWARENVIERAVVLHAARRMDVEVPREEIDAAYEEVKDRAGDVPAEEVKADIELQMRVDRLMKEGVGEAAEPTEEELREFYEAHREELTTPEQVHASHIVKHVDGFTDKKAAYEAILDVKMELAGGASFEQLAARHSDCPESAGDLGTFGRGQMVQQFEDVVFSMKPGEVSDVFLTQFGYHVAKLHERIESRTIPLEEVRDAIADEVLKRKRAGAVEEFVDSLKAKAVIEEVADE